MDNITEFFVDVPYTWKCGNNPVYNYWLAELSSVLDLCVEYLSIEFLISKKLNCFILNKSSSSTDVKDGYTRLYFKTEEELIQFMITYG